MKELIHTRNISVRCYETEEEAILVEGTLTDEREHPFFLYSANESREAGMVHAMTLRMVLSLPRLTILSVDAGMPVVPVAGCRDIAASVKKLGGLQIREGFTNRVRNLFSKTEGCHHLTHLVLAMSSAAVQGLWTYYSRKRPDGRIRMPVMDSSLVVDSCWLWRADGPLAARMREIQEGNGKDSA